MTLKELKKRHELGTKQMRTVRAQIRAQLKRRCLQRGCDESLEFKNASKLLCDRHKGRPLVELNKNNKERPVKVITRAEMRAKNRAKKKRYNERHGIKYDKNVRNRKVTELNLGTKGVLYAGQTLLYENYKEPLKPIERNKGHGFYGTVAITEDREYLQCHICGNLFSSLATHLRKHKVSAAKYKTTYGLSLTTALISEPLREALRERSISGKLPTKDGLPIWLQEYNRKVQSGEVKHKAHGGTTMSLERRNKLGLCPDQVLETIRTLADKLGHTPSLDEFNKEYGGRFTGAITFQHGTYLNAVSKLGMKSAKELKEHTSEQLLENLVNFQKEHGRIPMTTDFNRGLVGANRGTYIARFGSLNNARIEAGLNAILPLPFGQKIELSPQQYADYQNGHSVNEAATKQRQRRLNKRLIAKKERIAL